MALIALSGTAIANDWNSVVINHEEQFTDGGGVKRTLLVESIASKTRSLGNFEIQDLMSRVKVDGKQRTVLYSIVSHNQINVTVLGATPAERISFNILTNNENITEWKKGKRAQVTWIMEYDDVQLIGTLKGDKQRSTTGTDPISFAALTANVVSIKEVIEGLSGASSDDESTDLTMKILGGIFGPRVSGSLRLRCSKKKIEYVSCNAQCTATEDGCPCECLGIPCCSECIKVKETVWEYEGSGQVGG